MSFDGKNLRSIRSKIASQATLFAWGTRRVKIDEKSLRNVIDQLCELGDYVQVYFLNSTVRVQIWACPEDVGESLIEFHWGELGGTLSKKTRTDEILRMLELGPEEVRASEKDLIFKEW